MTAGPNFNPSAAPCPAPSPAVSPAGSTTGLHLMLYGTETFAIPNSDFPMPCILTMTWSGTASGPFAVAATATENFSIVYPADATLTTCQVTISVGGANVNVPSCVGLASAANFQPTAQSFSMPANGGAYTVQLIVGMTLPAASTGEFVTVNVPGLTSIDIIAQAGSIATPALSPFAMAMTAILLVALAASGLLKRQSGGSPLA